MEIDKTVVNYISTTLYNILPIEQSIKQLWGYDDRNFSLVDSSDHQTYILKIINEHDSRPELTGEFSFRPDQFIRQHHRGAQKLTLAPEQHL